MLSIVMTVLVSCEIVRAFSGECEYMIIVTAALIHEVLCFADYSILNEITQFCLVESSTINPK